MQATAHRVVSIDYTLTDDDGNVLDTSNGEEPLTYLHGAGNIIPGLEQALEGKSAGDELTVSIPPADAYGDYDPDLVVDVPRDRFPRNAKIAIGDQMEAESPEGPRLVTVVKVEKEQITVDANHPLAGEALNFAVRVVSVREATSDELHHGHVHDADCQH